MNKIYITKVTAAPKQGVRRFRCDRASALGNPHVMRNNSLEERNRVCDAFAKDIAAKGWSRAQLGYLQLITEVHQTQDIELVCHCAPLRCHCETIREYILSK